jgi:eukaryotic-like serine/threonine-protein kinase
MKAGTRLGPYELVSPIGAGGMGVVWRARDQRLGRDVAVKLLPPNVATHSGHVERLVVEARTVAALSHPNIVAIFDLGEAEGSTYVVTELLEGETLRERLFRSPISWREAAQITADVCEGLAAAHAKGIIHRDLKPENIFLTREGRVKILDFGLAKVAVEAEATDKTTPRLTEPGAVVGTVGYISPEQLAGEPATARSDLFSIGCVFYESLVGSPAFPGRTAAEIITAILRDEPPLLRRMTGVPPVLLDIITICLSKEPAQRSMTAAGIAKSLREVLGSGSQNALTTIIPRQRSSRRPLFAGGAALLVIAIAIVAVVRLRPGAAVPRGRGDSAVKSLVVLPFTTGGDRNELEYLGDGLAENLTNDLSRLTKLRVVSSGSGLKYRGESVDPRAVGHDLGVDAIITGRIVKLGDRLTINAELVDAGDASHLWGQQYVTAAGDLVEVERTMTRDISGKLAYRITDPQRLAREQTASSEAYQLYLRGRYQWNKFTPEGFRQAEHYFRQAIDADPSYALAYSGLADTYLVMGIHLKPPAEVMPKAKAAALRAVEIDPNLAEGHTSLGAVLFYYDWDWEKAGAELRRAIELNPGYATAHHAYSIYLRALGRHGEAIAEAKKALDIDPLSLVITIDLSLTYYTARQYDRAIEQMRRAIDLDPYSPLAHGDMGAVLQTIGRIPQALDELDRAAELSNSNRTEIAMWRKAWVEGGEKGYWRAKLDSANRSPGQTSSKMTIYCKLGDLDSAMKLAKEAAREHDSDIIFVNVKPAYDELHHHPEYPELLRALHLR